MSQAVTSTLVTGSAATTDASSGDAVCDQPARSDGSVVANVDNAAIARRTAGTANRDNTAAASRRAATAAGAFGLNTERAQSARSDRTVRRDGDERRDASGAAASGIGVGRARIATIAAGRAEASRVDAAR